MRTWIKFYTKINHDPDAGSLTWAHRGIWGALLALCGEIDQQNGDGSQTGQLDTQERTAWRIRCDPYKLGEALAEFAKREWIETREGILYIINYPRLQAKPPSQSRGAIRERVAAYRARNEDVTRLHQGVTPSESESDTESDTESEKIQSQTQTTARASVSPSNTPPTQNGTSEKADLAIPSLASPDSESPSGPDPPAMRGRYREQMVTLWESKNKVPISGQDAKQLVFWCNEYGTNTVWAAMQKALANNAKNLGGYMRTVLESQQTRGP